MFLRFTLLLLCLAIPSTVLGQVQIIPGPNGPQVLPSQFPSRTGLPSGGYPSGPTIQPYQPQGTFHNRIPGGWVSPNVVTGINNQTGGLNTSNSQFADSAFINGREQGKANRRWVNQPVYGANGQITGYQEGYEWKNAITGQGHHELNTFTPNSSNGVHQHFGAVQGLSLIHI